MPRARRQRPAAGIHLSRTELSGNSQRPNCDVAPANSCSTVYYALRNGPNRNSTLLIINYDEHGGNYDHLAPPGDGPVGGFGFDFKRFGVRVPRVPVSPLTAARTMFRAPAGNIWTMPRC
jgi:phospholipase C